jgi:hypothetical protein
MLLSVANIIAVIIFQKYNCISTCQRSHNQKSCTNHVFSGGTSSWLKLENGS